MHLLSNRFTLAHYISNVTISEACVKIYFCLTNLTSTHLLVLLRQSFEFLMDIIAWYQERTCVCMSHFYYGNEMNSYFLTTGNQQYTSIPRDKKYLFEINKQLGVHNFIFECCGKLFLRRTHQWV
jgi:hypothetical protein